MKNPDNNSSETNFLLCSFFDNPEIGQEVLNDPVVPVSLSCARLLCFDLNRTDVYLLACSLLDSTFYIYSGRTERPVVCV